MRKLIVWTVVLAVIAVAVWVARGSFISAVEETQKENTRKEQEVASNMQAVDSGVADIKAVPVPQAASVSPEAALADNTIPMEAPAENVIPAEKTAASPIEQNAVHPSQTEKTNQLKKTAELVRQNTPESTRELATLLKDANSADVQIAALRGLLQSQHAAGTSAEISESLKALYAKPIPAEVLNASTELLSKAPSRESVHWLKAMLEETTNNASQSARAAGAIIRLHKSSPGAITQEDADAADRKLKDLYANSSDSGVRFQVVTSLTTSDNMEFLESAMETEQDPKIRAAIGRAVIASKRTQGGVPASNEALSSRN